MIGFAKRDLRFTTYSETLGFIKELTALGSNHLESKQPVTLMDPGPESQTALPLTIGHTSRAVQPVHIQLNTHRPVHAHLEI